MIFERLRAADLDPANWLTYSGQYNGQRYSRLTVIDRENAENLEIRWIHQLRTVDPVETTPLVVDGVMYLTHANDVIALDAASGRSYWTYARRYHARGTGAKNVVPGHRNGFFYVLDRETGAFEMAREFALQTWARVAFSFNRPMRRLGSAHR